MSSIRPKHDLKHIRTCSTGSEAYRLLVSVFSGANGTRSGLLANTGKMLNTNMSSSDNYATLQDKVQSIGTMIHNHAIFASDEFTKHDFLDLLMMGTVLERLNDDKRFSIIIPSIRLLDDLTRQPWLSR